MFDIVYLAVGMIIFWIGLSVGWTAREKVSSEDAIYKRLIEEELRLIRNKVSK